MFTISIQLTTPEEVQKIVRLNERQDFDIDAASGHYIVDAKSPMGFFSLNLSKPITITLHTEDEDIINAYKNEIAGMKI